ncbi:hypothetical protein RIR_jg11755.t1 [Rhizophagus irregularis DAOM 181602=DAOM 197198]|nr:hypothetical protein RIR_jg11755.t1 [Rhizophagus irregularis DAOM 181602=DAOM 197198]
MPCITQRQKEFGSNVNTDIPGIQLQHETPIFQLRIQLKCGRQYSRISVSAWILNPKGILAPTWILKSQRKIGSYLDTESQRLPKIRKPKFVGWISDE